MSDTPQAQERPMMLLLDDNNQSSQHWTLDRDDMTVGREEGTSDIVIPRREISRQHLRCFRQGEQFMVEDLNSKNGTWVNGQQLKGSRPISDGDEIHLALVARLQFVGSGATAPLPFDPPAYLNNNGRLRLDPESRRVYINDVEVDPPLSPPQYRLLELLFANPGQIFTREVVTNAVWPDAMGEGVSEQAIDALVRRLRDRLAEIDPEHQYILTIRGHGFRFDNA